MEKVIYFDNAATTFPKPDCVYDAVNECMRNFGVNAGRGSYSLSRKASGIIDELRKEIIEVVNLEEPKKVVLQPSATIAMNQILNGLDWSKIKNVYVTPFEHNAIMRTLEKIKSKHKINIYIIPFNNISMELNEDEFKRTIITNRADLIIMSQVSNVTGLILPIEKILEIGNDEGTISVIDAAQAFGLINIDMKKNDIDFLVFAGHKTMYGPFGLGGFIYNSKYELRSLITGGTGSDSTNLLMPNKMPTKYEAGSYDISAIFGVLTGLKWIKSNNVDSVENRERILTKYCIEKLRNIYGIELYIPKNDLKHIGIISFNLNNYRADELAQILDEDFDICVRAGHHCAPKVGEFLGGNAKNGVVRISLGYFNEEYEIDKLVQALEELV